MRGAWLAFALLFASAAMAPAQVEQSSTGRCSPNIASVAGDVRIDLDCPYLQATYVLSDSDARALAGHYEITTVAVTNFFARLGTENVPPYLAAARFEELVHELIESRRILADLTLQGVAGDRLDDARRAVADGDIETANEVFGEVIDSARSLQNQTLQQIRDIARVHGEKGRTELLLHRYGQARESFRAALSLLPAVFAGDIARLSVELSKATYLQGGGIEDVYATAAAAVEKTEDLAEIDPVLRLEALANMLRGHFLASDSDAAVKLFDDSIEPLLIRPEVRAHHEALFCFACLGGVLMQNGKPADALRILERGAAFSEDLVSPDRLGLAAIYTNLAAVREGHAAQVEALDRAEELMNAAFPAGGHPDFANIHFKRARLADAMGDEPQAADHAVRAIEVRLRVFGPGGLPAQMIEPLIFSGTAPHIGPDTLYMRGIPRDPVVLDGAIAELDDAIRRRFDASDATEAMVSVRMTAAQVLVQHDHGAAGLALYRDAIRITDDRGETPSIGTAHFVVAQLIDVFGLDGPEVADIHYAKALRLYERNDGFDAERTWDVRRCYMAFLLANGRMPDAMALLGRFDAQCPDNTSCAVHWQRDELQAMIDG